MLTSMQVDAEINLESLTEKEFKNAESLVKWVKMLLKDDIKAEIEKKELKISVDLKNPKVLNLIEIVTGFTSN